MAFKKRITSVDKRDTLMIEPYRMYSEHIFKRPENYTQSLKYFFENHIIHNQFDMNKLV